ncbi:MAG: hypothetical protein ACI30V_07605, partial [Muribaculaceae bacterium]
WSKIGSSAIWVTHDENRSEAITASASIIHPTPYAPQHRLRRFFCIFSAFTATKTTRHKNILPQIVGN